MNVEKGLRYLFGNAYSQQLAIQTHDGSLDNPNMNGDGVGVYFHSSVPDDHHSIYETSLALMVIVCTGAPDRLVDTGIFSGQTYRDVAANTIDFLAYGQVDGGAGRGGWTYEPMDNSEAWSDNSNSGFVTMALDYAEAPLASPPRLVSV